MGTRTSSREQRRGMEGFLRVGISLGFVLGEIAGLQGGGQTRGASLEAGTSAWDCGPVERWGGGPVGGEKERDSRVPDPPWRLVPKALLIECGR